MAVVHVTFPTFLSFTPRGKDFKISVNTDSIGVIAPYFEQGKDPGTQIFCKHNLDVSWVTDIPYEEVMGSMRTAAGQST